MLRHARRCCVLQVPWTSQLPPATSPQWATLGRALNEFAQSVDVGPEAFKECMTARGQLERIVRSAGYDYSIYTFGGLAVLRLLETCGDVDFVAVGDTEPTPEEASEIVSRLSREMRRLGMRTQCIPRARTPIIKADRVSRAIPGTPLSPIAARAVFQFARSVTVEEQQSFGARLSDAYGAIEVSWSMEQQQATAQFGSTSALMNAITEVRKHISVDIPIRLPIDPRQGPEIYRYPFDLCLKSTGLRNSQLFGEGLARYPFARHVILALKRWGRHSKIINSMDGLLTSYGVTVLASHFMSKVGLIPWLQPESTQPRLLPKEPVYLPLPSSDDEEAMRELGYAVGLYFEYYGRIFDYENDVVCAVQSVKKNDIGWSSTMSATRPPYYFLAIRDPYYVHNVARNLNAPAVHYVRECHSRMCTEIEKSFDDPKFVVSLMTTSPPRPLRKEVEAPAEVVTDARRLLKQMEFQQRKDAIEKVGRNAAQLQQSVRHVQDVTRTVVGWIRATNNKD